MLVLVLVAGLATSADASQESWEILDGGSPGPSPAHKSSTPSPGWETLSPASSSSLSPELGVVPLDEREPSADVKRNLFYQGYGADATRRSPRFPPRARGS